MCVFVCIFLISVSSGDDDIRGIFPRTIIFFQGSGSNPWSRKICVFFEINDDDILENDESVTVSLGSINLPQNVIVLPDTTEILILDDDGMLIIVVFPYLQNTIITIAVDSIWFDHILNSKGLRDVPTCEEIIVKKM